MIFDAHGLPRTKGETDFMDSARLAGMLATFGHWQAPDLLQYTTEEGYALRYPYEDPNNAASNNPLNVTRDQIICLASGLAAQGLSGQAYEFLIDAEARGFIPRAQNVEADVPGSTKPWYNGADIMLLSDMGHLSTCSGGAATAFQRLWLRFEIMFHNYLTPLREPNQLMCKAKVAGDEYERLLLRNPKFFQSIWNYWAFDGSDSPRKEEELAKFFISYYASKYPNETKDMRVTTKFYTGV